MDTTKYTIGLSNKYYTLWEKGIDHWYYVKNISMDKEVAKGKYPGVEINLSFRGTRPISFTKYEIPPFDGTFTKGKYKGQSIEGHEDEEYMKWYAENSIGSTKEEVEAVIKEVEKFGNWEWEVKTYTHEDDYGDTREFSLSSFKRIIPQKELDEIERVSKELLSGTFEIPMERNADEFGNFLIYDKYNTCYNLCFDEVKEMCYAGYYYGLPMINGKAKRVKGKNIRLIEVVKEKNIFIIKKFEII